MKMRWNGSIRMRVESGGSYESERYEQNFFSSRLATLSTSTNDHRSLLQHCNMVLINPFLPFVLIAEGKSDMTFEFRWNYNMSSA